MERILFVGNGFNQVSDDGAGWKSLLNKLAGTAKTKHEEEVRDAKPFTLWFEELSSRSRRKHLKTFVANSLSSTLKHNRHHVDAMTLSFQHVLTTNYDYNLERATEDNWRSNFAAPETYYSLFRRRSSGDRHIWHIHGELDNVGSIMLGHQQYSGYIQKIRNYLTSGVLTEVKDRAGIPYLSKFSSKNVAYKGDVETWVDLFLKNEVHIIGFGFDYTETHLWDLIIRKQRLRRGSRSSIGQAVFHRCSREKQSTTDEARLSMLSALGVQVIDHAADSYTAAYENCIQSLR